MSVALTYQVDPSLQGCPTDGDLRAAIVTQLGADPFAPDVAVADQRVHVAIGRTAAGSLGAGTDAQITWFDKLGNRQGERHLSSESDECAELASGVAFAVAVQIQLQAAEAQSKAIAPPPPSPPTVVPAPARPRVKRPPPAVLAGVGAYAQHGLSPNTTGGLRVFVGITSDSWSVDLGLQATLPSELRLPDGTGFAARDVSARLAPCWRLRPLGICAVGGLGGLYVRGEGVDHVGTPSALNAAAGLRLQLAWPVLHRFNVLINGEVLTLLTPRDVVLNRTVVWSTAPIVAGVGLDLAAVFR